MTRVGALALVLLTLVGCLRPLKFDAARLERRCGIEPGVELDEAAARCVARLAGMRDGRRCPLEIEPHPERPVWVARETCSGIVLELERRGGRIAEIRLDP